jgi:hypothetical protein
MISLYFFRVFQHWSSQASPATANSATASFPDVFLKFFQVAAHQTKDDCEFYELFALLPYYFVRFMYKQFVAISVTFNRQM